MKQKKFLALVALVLVLVMCVGVFAACDKPGPDPDNGGNNPCTEHTDANGDGKCDNCGADCGDDPDPEQKTGWEDPNMYTMNDYTGQMPSQWCTILSNDNTNSSLEGYFVSSFYEFNYEYDADGNIVSGGYTLDYSAATSLVDVTSKYAGQYGLAEDATSNHAFAMTLRNDLVWDDGTPITAADFVYTMSQQLSPNYLFDTASNYYSGNYIIHNANNYVMQGQSGWYAADSVNAIYSTDLDSSLIFTLAPASSTAEGYASTQASVRGVVGFPASYTTDLVVAFFNANGTALDAEIIKSMEGKSLAEIKADATMNAQWEELIGWWQTDPNEELDFFVTEYTYPEMDFSEVGFFVGDNEYELVMVTDTPLYPLNEDGSLTYEAGYYFSGWPLVKRDLWEACENQSNGIPYSNSYCTSLETSASWGPYKLTNYQDQKTYTVSRNDEWFGYGLDQYKGQYQTDAIVTNKIEEWDTAWMAFQKGELDGIGMDVKIAADYRTSERAYFTPDTFTFDLNIQSVANSRTEERNNLLLNYEDFRKAISLALDRDDYCAKNSPSSLAALGLLNSMYYYDVENGKTYRESIQAKEAILNAYGATKNEDGSWKVGAYNYNDIDEALDATTGYNPTLARELVDKAVAAAIAAGHYAEGEEVVLTYGIETQTANTDRVKNWFQAAFDAMTEGTKLEGKIKIEYFYFASATWSEQFANGEYDLCFGAWGQAAFNPAYLLCETQIGDANRYAVGWDPTTVEVTVKATPDENHPTGEYTYNLAQWSSILQGKADAPVNFKEFPMEDQLAGLGAVETAILQAYYSIPVYSRFSASLMGYKCDYISYEHNTFMGYGGLRYMTYNYNDTEWAEFVASNDGMLDYK